MHLNITAAVLVLTVSVIFAFVSVFIHKSRLCTLCSLVRAHMAAPFNLFFSTHACRTLSNFEHTQQCFYQQHRQPLLNCVAVYSIVLTSLAICCLACSN